MAGELDDVAEECRHLEDTEPQFHQRILLDLPNPLE